VRGFKRKIPLLAVAGIGQEGVQNIYEKASEKGEELISKAQKEFTHINISRNIQAGAQNIYEKASEKGEELISKAQKKYKKIHVLDDIQEGAQNIYEKASDKASSLLSESKDAFAGRPLDQPGPEVGSADLFTRKNYDELSGDEESDSSTTLDASYGGIAPYEWPSRLWGFLTGGGDEDDSSGSGKRRRQRQREGSESAKIKKQE
jgi:hypothetical protein